MRTLKSAKSKKPLYITAAVVAALIVTAVVGILVFNTSNPEDNTTTTTSSEEVNSNKTATPQDEGLPSNSTETTSEEVPVSENLQVTITSFSQSNGVVQVSTKTSGEGTCVFAFKPADGGKPVTKQMTVDNKSCNISIPETEFAYLGQWALSVTFYNDNLKAEVQQDVSIN